MTFELNVTITCVSCDRRLRVDNTHAPLCSKCWEKTPAGKEYMRLKQRESRKNRKYSTAKAPKCVECGASLHKDADHAPLCSKCWVKTPAGKDYRNKLNKKSKIKSLGKLHELQIELGEDIPISHLQKRISAIV